MASHHDHHYHHLHHQQQLLHTAAATANCCCCNSCSHQCAPMSYPSPQSTEPLLQAIVSELLQQGGGGACCQTQTHKIHQEVNFHQQKQNFQHEQQDKIVLSSLLNRIDALEASLHNFSLSSTSNHCSSFSLRDIATRVIQTHFRAFLVRRSRTLRQLKELALIKSIFNSLKLSISKKTHFDFLVVSRKAMDLLLKLDSIQGFDPMIRDGKRSISNDLIKFLEFVDGFAVKRQEISCKAAKNVRFMGNSSKSKVLRSNCGDLRRDQIELMNKLRDRIEKIHGFSRIAESEDEDEGFHQLIDDDEEENPRISINGKSGVSRNKNGVLMKRQVFAQPRVKKSVTFAENGNVYRIFGNSNGSISSGDGTLTDESVPGDNNGQGTEVEDIKGLPHETEDEEEENGESLQISDGERNSTRSLRTEGRNETNEDYNVEDGQFVFSAPVPVKMESRADLMKKRKAVKIVT